MGPAAGVRHRGDGPGAGQAVAGVLHRPLEALGREPATALVVGDDLEADIGGGSAVGAATVLVRTGKGDPPSGAGVEPDAVIDSIADLPDLLRH